GYFSWSDNKSSASVAYSCMTGRDDIFVYAGHGNSGMIAFYDSKGNLTGSISVNSKVTSGTDNKYISSIQDNGLNHARIVIYLGCNTGSTYVWGSLSQYNLVDDTFDKGAHYVLGVEIIVYTIHTNSWLDYFLENLATGCSVEDSVFYATESLGDIMVDANSDGNFSDNERYDAIPLYTRGDGSQYLDIS
ncbi:MAG: hypothetical protein II373_02705, partial [Clostridia bacterium]|nr:hypothetical protein [Clostridia bacterium]